ncbi:glycerate kinase [Microbacterium sp. NIBRBAC000506063]|uniref:glycerate kinase n=1 Tax=Microbacterium sp. NIBRBAC000506063 TaxID=2734618 RepID=UPI001BB596F8|nr:glycerate kinase [Microbacterium sp. NIBRBAC000506063]QTV79121.1 glycerate kinase [Microbacterium sp. NIBRBAC000506063]
MRIVFAPDSFKGTLSASDAAAALAEGWRSVDADAELVLRPMADGGEGTVEAFAAAVDGTREMAVTVTGPAGDPIPARWLLLPPTEGTPRGTAVIDLASTSGIELLGDRREPWDAGTAGFGEAIAAALDHGVSRLVLGIGSSASTDGGVGMLTALGARILDAEGAPVASGARGLLDAASVELAGLRPAPEVIVLTDVTHPLTGLRGAAAVFGPQKGLIAPEDIARVDAALGRFAGLIGLDPATPGTGAAGGVGGALVAWGARLVPGAAEVARMIGLPEALATADVVVTGEGSYDGQSGDGKVPSYVADLAARSGTVSLLAAGRIAADADAGLFAASVSLTEIAGFAEAALADPERWLREVGVRLARSVPPLPR